ncbi:hypothetical protein [Aureimonas mangrovi]|uniref:hypothetical protein n=1 Tax=Aureimonas mangrovi TaxID=2758041 RepID=UPI00163D7AE7|nr:hypothetical protein [Aureimonas mangrovi]
MSRGSVQVQGLDQLAKRFDFLGDALPQAMQAALDDVAEAAVKAMATKFNGSIEGGPAPFTKIVPGSKRSSVVTSKRRKGGDGEPEASIRFQRIQSAYLKFHLDDDRGRRETERDAGDVGAASAYNLTPIRKNLSRWQGISVNAQGNLPRGAVRKLVRRSRTSQQVLKDNEDRNRRGVAKKLGLPEDDPQVAAIMATKKIRGKKRSPRRSRRCILGRPPWSSGVQNRFLAASGRFIVQTHFARSRPTEDQISGVRTPGTTGSRRR